jgi:hypothetical protein
MSEPDYNQELITANQKLVMDYQAELNVERLALELACDDMPGTTQMLMKTYRDMAREKIAGKS